MIELKLGETITLKCDAHGEFAEGVTLDNLSKTEQDHREALGCYYIIHVQIVNKLLDKIKEATK